MCICIFRGPDGCGGCSRPPQRGPPAGAWKPDVKPVGAMPSQPTQTGQTFTKTSLAREVPVRTFVGIGYCSLWCYCFI